MAPTDEQWMHSCLQSVDVSRRISLQVKTWKRKATIYLKPIRIQNHKFSDVKCSERSVKDSELIEAGQHFVSRELLHSFTCFTSQGHTRCQKSRLRLFIQISGVHHGNGCYNLVQVLPCEKQHEQLVISCLRWHLLTYILLYIIYIYIVYILYCHSASSPWTGLSHPPRGDGRTRDHLPLPQPKRQNTHFMAFPPFQNPLKISSKGQKMSKIFL